jgi:hypothetical protein
MAPLWLCAVLVLLLGGCIATSRFPEQCSITQPDKQGTGYTIGTFPCKLEHREGKQP